MDDVSRVPEERNPARDEAAGDPERERVGLRLGLEGETTELETEAPLEFLQKVAGIGSEKSRNRAASLRPDDGRAVAEGSARAQGQDRERSGREEVLDGPAFVIPLMRHRRDDAGLIIRPADPADSRLFPEAGTGPVRRHQEVRRDRPLPRDRHPDRVGLVREPIDAGGLQDHSGLPAAVDQGRGDGPALHHVSEGLSGARLAAEGQERRAGPDPAGGCR